MIPLGLLAFFKGAGSFLKSPLGMVAIALVALFLWTEHVKHHATAALLAQERQKTEQEHNRRLDVETQAQQQAQQDADRLAQQEKQNASLVARIATLSHRHDRDRCLGLGSVQRLRSIGQQAGH